MYRTRSDQTCRVYFPVVTAGALVPGLLAGAFTVSVLAPDNTLLGPVLVPVQSVRAGVYYVDVPASLWASKGAGNYGVVVEVGAPNAQVFTDVIAVLDEAATFTLGVTFDAAANTFRCHLALLRDLGQVTTGLTNATLRLYDRTGTALIALQTAVAPDAQGVFAFDIAAPAFVVGETETYWVATVQSAALPARTFRAIAHTTFSRTS